MLKIYTVPVSLYCAKLPIVLRHKNLAWQEEAPPGGYRSAAYKAIVPSGNIPTLINGDLTIADSEATAEYLNDIHPEPPMLPATPDERAKIRERSRFHDTRLEPEIRALFPFIKAIQGADDLIAAQAAAISEKLRQLADLLTELGTPIAIGFVPSTGFTPPATATAFTEPAMTIPIRFSRAIRSA